MKIYDLFKKYIFTIIFSCLFLILFTQFLFSKIQYSNTLGNSKLTSLVCNRDSVIYFEGLNKKSEYAFEFRLLNVGKNRLYISSLNASCGCTKILADKIKADVGDSIKINGILNLSGKSGKNFTLIKFNANTRQKNHSIRLIYTIK